jgi:hypothetical protein
LAGGFFGRLLRVREPHDRIAVGLLRDGLRERVDLGLLRHERERERGRPRFAELAPHGDVAQRRDLGLEARGRVHDPQSPLDL